MPLLHDIQADLLRTESDIASALLKFRLLAARLGSRDLADWVKHESEGYPDDVKVPAYRVIGITFRATFWGRMDAKIENAPIPTSVIEKLAGDHWTQFHLRQSIGTVEALLKKSDGNLQLDASGLVHILGQNYFDGYACADVKATVGRSSIEEIRNIVKSRILSLTIELESSVPEASQIFIGPPQPNEFAHSETTSKIAQQVIYNTVTNITSSGAGANINVASSTGNIDEFVAAAITAGIPTQQAAELASLVASESPTDPEQPFGKKALSWLAENGKKAGSGAIKVGLEIGSDLLKEAVKKFYGLA